ncbi:MAG: hypothetical protein QF515_18780 [Pseudomonadales bacterium]|jgi:hypothetical protein|nr:hypothetical protein [Pseudomonadales bacterium]MDP6469969.1 hypothetical protein [Pseudomonadales bacterium]MDP6829136.1 hypothetical protein [Pseudomonadales bacterium]|tara:strand:+ start:1476 stop:1967 length:492 start_codon:yes stop_codon:yes gene_type:complete
MKSCKSSIGAYWGISGVLAILVFAVYRLSSITIESFTYVMDWSHWALLIGNTAFMAYAEGYKGFQLNFAPKVANRARMLREQPALSAVLLAPLYCMHYFSSTLRQLASTYLLTGMIIILVYLFHQLSQPWRGLLDAGVVVGLSWGIVSIAIIGFKAIGETEAS